MLNVLFVYLVLIKTWSSFQVKETAINWNIYSKHLFNHPNSFSNKHSDAILTSTFLPLLYKWATVGLLLEINRLRRANYDQMYDLNISACNIYALTLQTIKNSRKQKNNNNSLLFSYIHTYMSTLKILILNVCIYHVVKQMTSLIKYNKAAQFLRTS